LNGAVPDAGFGEFDLCRLQPADLVQFLQCRQDNWMTVAKLEYGGDTSIRLLHCRHEWDHHIASTTQRRRLFRCDDGHLGLGPADTRSGDLVFVLAGGTHPCILRPSDKIHDSLFTLVGECYIDHLMDRYGVDHPTDAWRRRSSSSSSRQWYGETSCVRNITLGRSRESVQDHCPHLQTPLDDGGTRVGDQNHWQTIALV
jgi:hypothetical protein